MLFNVSFVKPLPSGANRAEIRASDLQELGRLLRKRYPKQRPNSITQNGNSILLSNVPDDYWYEQREEYFRQLGWKTHSEEKASLEVGKSYLYAPDWFDIFELAEDSILEVNCTDVIEAVSPEGVVFVFSSERGTHYNHTCRRETAIFMTDYAIYDDELEDPLAPLAALVKDFFSHNYYYHNIARAHQYAHHESVSKRILEILDYVKTKFGYVPSICIRDNHIPDVTLVKE